MRDLSDCPDGSASTCWGEGGPTLRLRCAAGEYVKRDEQWHATRMKNAVGFRPRQRRHLQAHVGPRAKAISHTNEVKPCNATRETVMFDMGETARGGHKCTLIL